PSAIRPLVDRAFATAKECVKHNPHELSTVNAAHGIVISEIEFSIEAKNPAITVEASGSCWSGDANQCGNTQLKIEVQPLWHFVPAQT
ncbi:MAG TPA: hypothetical protein VHA06_10135, partial [Candidatus Angelobacter sp.]|nr:hypothetical protein [Candidatus Angelobacter sp.]